MLQVLRKWKILQHVRSHYISSSQKCRFPWLRGQASQMDLLKFVFVYAKTRGCIITGPWSNMLVSFPSEAHIFRGGAWGSRGGRGGVTLLTPARPKIPLFLFYFQGEKISLAIKYPYLLFVFRFIKCHFISLVLKKSITSK